MEGQLQFIQLEVMVVVLGTAAEVVVAATVQRITLKSAITPSGLAA